MPCGGSPLPPGDNPWVAIIRWLSVHATAHTSVLSLLVGESAARAYFLAPGSAMPQILGGHQGESGEHEKRDPDGARRKGQHVGRVSLVPHEGGDEGVTRRFDPLALADYDSLICPAGCAEDAADDNVKEPWGRRTRQRAPWPNASPWQKGLWRLHNT
jgi:hypothetical protein